MPGVTLPIEALHKFIEAFNTARKDEIVSNLHFPHLVHSDGNDPTLYRNGDEFWASLSGQLANMRESEDWAYSTLDLAEILNETQNTVHVLVEFSRRHASGNAYGVARGVWIVTRKDGRWGLQARSTLPKSGNISSLAGQKMDHS